MSSILTLSGYMVIWFSLGWGNCSDLTWKYFQEFLSTQNLVLKFDKIDNATVAWKSFTQSKALKDYDNITAKAVVQIYWIF